jgi:hypothetical protein
MKDAQARAVEALLKSLPQEPAYAYRKAVVARAPTELNPGERSDVSWISTEVVDRQGEVVRARGMNDAQFAANPLVTLGHAYWLPPVGRSLWRKAVKDGDLRGIKAKTAYPARPASWPDADPWPPDKVLTLVQAGMLQGKSIGFLPLKVHAPTDRELEQNAWTGCRLVIDEWLLLEYACVFLPANQNALVEAVSKGDLSLTPDLVKALGLDDGLFARPAPRPEVVRHTALEQIEAALGRRLAGIDLQGLIDAALDKARGRV